MYEQKALLKSIQRRRKNLQLFAETIRQERLNIKHELQIISQIDIDHPDVKALKNTIKKRRLNIQIFSQAIADEKKLILEEQNYLTIDPLPLTPYP